MAIEPSQPCRHRRRGVDIKLALTKGIASRHRRKRVDIQLASMRGLHRRHRREEVDIGAQTKGIMDSRHRSKEVDMSKWHRSIALHRCHAFSEFTLLHQLLLYHLLRVYQYTAHNVPASLHPLLASCHKESSSEQSSSSSSSCTTNPCITSN